MFVWDCAYKTPISGTEVKIMSTYPVTKPGDGARSQQDIKVWRPALRDAAVAIPRQDTLRRLER